MIPRSNEATLMFRSKFIFMKVRKFVEAFDLIMMEEIELADPWDMENNNRHMVFR